MGTSRRITLSARKRIIALITLAFSSPAAAETINVPVDFATIQAAIDAAQNGDTILVADGTYTGEGNRDIRFNDKTLTVRSENGPQVCIIDCEDACRGFVIVAQTGDIVIEGFTVTRGFSGLQSASPRKGGGMIISQASPTVIGCIFDDNHAHSGAGIYVATAPASPVFINCAFANHVFDGSGTIEDIHIGAGAYAGTFATPTFHNCTFVNNHTSPGGDHVGGGLVSDRDSDVLVENSVFWGNSALFGDQVGVHLDGVVTIRYCDLQGGEAEVEILDGGVVNWGPGNIELDPMLDAAYVPAPGSPCIDAGDNDAVPAGTTTDAYGASRFVDDPATADSGQGIAPIVDMGAVEFQTSAVPCPADVNGDGNVGFNDLVGVLAAWGPCPGCPEDVSANGNVGFEDVVAVLAAWGPCA